MFKGMKLGTKIMGACGLITLILVVSVGSTLVQVNNTAEITNRIVDLRTPTSEASLRIINGVNHSLAALRGWIILGKEGFRKERAQAWSDEIDVSLAAMKKLSANWTNPKNVEDLAIIEKNLIEFRRYQQEIEDIAQTVDNTPAMKILFEQAAPQAAVLVTSITAMIDLEAKQEATAER